MSLYKRDNSPFWYCEFEDGGKPVRKSTGVLISTKSPKAEERSKAKARQQEALVKKDYFEEKLRTIEAGAAKPQITLKEFSKKFLERAAIDHQGKPNYCAFLRDRVAALLRFKSFEHALISRIDEELINDFVVWRSSTTKVFGVRKGNGKKSETADTFRPISVATINRDLTVLRMMLNKAREMKYQAPLVKIARLKGEHNRERIVSPQEEKSYLEAAPELLRDFATVALDTGMRPDSEICAMRWENVHFEEGYIYVPGGKTKNARRPIPLTERVKTVLRRRHEDAGKPDMGHVFAGEQGAALQYSVLDTQHDRTLEKLKWTTDEPGKRLRIYDFRHTALTRLYQSGARTFTLKAIAGHASVKTTERYINLPEDHHMEAFTAFEAFNKHAAEQAAKQSPRESAQRATKSA